MELNTLLQYKPYSTARPEKRALYAGLLTGLTQFHRGRCPEYGRLLSSTRKGSRRSPRKSDMIWQRACC